MELREIRKEELLFTPEHNRVYTFLTLNEYAFNGEEDALAFYNEVISTGTKTH